MANLIFDKATELRNIADGPVTSSGANPETGIQVDPRFKGPMVVAVHVTAIDNAGGNETYVFNVEISDLVGGTYSSIAQVDFDRDKAMPATLQIPVNGELADFIDSDSVFMRINPTLGGTTPSITYGAYLTTLHAGGPGHAKSFD